MIHALAIASLLSCTTNDTSGTPAGPAAVVDAALLAKTWQLRMADAGQRARFESDPGWGLTFQRSYSKALASFAEDGGKARVHLVLWIHSRG